ncbi:MAG: hypothetical protein JRH20_01130 [Deltaproteobacteria bacterium]|nr:hypothetical protein [Deltaproteobacteria bacterium]
MNRVILEHKDLKLSLESRRQATSQATSQANLLTLSFSLQGEGPMHAWLHWGLDAEGHEASGWRAPPEALWPVGTRPFDAHAVQSPFNISAAGEGLLEFTFPARWDGRGLHFVLYLEEPTRWLNNAGGDYRVALNMQERPRPTDTLNDEFSEAEGVGPVQHALLEGDHELAWIIEHKEGAPTQLHLVSDSRLPLHLHWGLVQRGRRWMPPPEACWPEGSVPAGDKAIESPFVAQAGLQRLSLVIDAPEARGVAFVLRRGQSWLKNGETDFHIPLRAENADDTTRPAHAPAGLVNAIIEAETERGSWTLMHRFNLCHDLLHSLPEGEPTRGRGLVALYVWLRFSALRQLHWQRNYNTKPSELAHAQDRLTRALADLYGRDPRSREMVRLMLATMGHGSDGQRVRDEILEIMHRHRIKEVTGHFLEEWHQKLHNNTTYDDVVICEGYLSFLHTNGDQGRFYDYLSSRGVTRARLESYERPIVTPPDFHPGLKEPLLHDFRRYLVTLKRVHQGTDFGVAFERARHQLSHELRQRIEPLQHSDPEDAVSNCRRLVMARHDLRAMLDTGAGARDLLFLDLALDERLRVVIESARQHIDSLDSWLQLSWAAAANTALSFEDEELTRCAQHLRLLARTKDLQKTAARELHSVRERTARALASLSNRLHGMLQPWANHLGVAFEAEDFTVALFAEEVVRGRAPFALSAALRGLSGPLHAAAELGQWEVVSPGEARGRLCSVDALHELIERPPSEPTVALCQHVNGDEEIPSSVVAVVTTASVDLVSHVAVRARNAGVLFVTAYEAATLEPLTKLKGEHLHIETSPAGALQWRSIAAGESIISPTTPRRADPRTFAPPPVNKAGPWAVTEDAFTPAGVGGKSRNLRCLRQFIGDDVASVPHGFALPFGSCERALALCPALQGEHDALITSLTGTSHDEQTSVFGALQKLLCNIDAPPALRDALREAADRSRVPWPTARWPEIWQRIKSVWASKWNERAARARRARGMPDTALSMAILVQELVPAEVAFVLHTVDPRSGDHQRLYGEVVVGLGETLVGNHPGRALSFVGHKETLEIEVLTYPSKSYALHGGGLIFRSDSSGEDLAGYAGAGLYDSFPLDENTRVSIDYTQIPLITDLQRQHELLQGLLRLGIDIEARFGSPQDVEGAVLKDHYHVVQTRPQVGLDDIA